MEIIIEDTFLKIKQSVNKGRLWNNGFRNTHITSEYIQNPTTSPHDIAAILLGGSHSLSPGLPRWPPSCSLALPQHSISAQQPA